MDLILRGDSSATVKSWSIKTNDPAALADWLRDTVEQEFSECPSCEEWFDDVNEPGKHGYCEPCWRDMPKDECVNCGEKVLEGDLFSDDRCATCTEVSV